MPAKEDIINNVEEIRPARNMWFRAAQNNAQIAAKVVHSILYVLFIVALTSNYNKMQATEEAHKVNNAHTLEIQKIRLAEVLADQQANNDLIAVTNVVLAQVRAEMKLLNDRTQEIKPNE